MHGKKTLNFRSVYVCVYINTSICMYYLHMYEWEGEGKAMCTLFGLWLGSLWPVKLH